MSQNKYSDSLSDHDFLKGVHPPPEEPSLALAIRAVIADWCGLPPESLHPEQATIDLHMRMRSGWAEGWDETGFLFKLEEFLGRDLDMKATLPPFVGGRFLFWHVRGPDNLGSWVGQAVQALRQS